MDESCRKLLAQIIELIKIILDEGQIIQSACGLIIIDLENQLSKSHKIQLVLVHQKNCQICQEILGKEN